MHPLEGTRQLQRYLEAALEIAADARRLILARRDTALEVRLKLDSSYVTDVDLAVERLVRDRIESLFPDHGVLGEELGITATSGSYVWSIDPIDGTRSFAHGIPLFGSILALMVDGAPVLGVIDHPALGTCFSAALGLGAFKDSQRLRISSVDLDPRDVIVGIGERRQFIAAGNTEVFDRLMREHPGVRTYCDCFGHTLTAAGALGGMLDVNLNVWDYAATEVLIKEAGGKWVVTERRDPGKADVAFGNPGIVDWLARMAR